MGGKVTPGRTKEAAQPEMQTLETFWNAIDFQATTLKEIRGLL